MPDACQVALTPGALADLDRLDTFLRALVVRFAKGGYVCL